MGVPHFWKPPNGHFRSNPHEESDWPVTAGKGPPASEPPTEVPEEEDWRDCSLIMAQTNEDP